MNTNNDISIILNSKLPTSKFLIHLAGFRDWGMGVDHWALDIGLMHLALRIGHWGMGLWNWELGVGHRALGIGNCRFAHSPLQMRASRET